MSRPGKCRDRQMSRPAHTCTRLRQMSRPANARDRQMSRPFIIVFLPANVATGKCRDRQKSRRQIKFQSANVRRSAVATGKCRDLANVAIGKSPTGTKSDRRGTRPALGRPPQLLEITFGIFISDITKEPIERVLGQLRCLLIFHRYIISLI